MPVLNRCNKNRGLLLLCPPYSSLPLCVSFGSRQMERVAGFLLIGFSQIFDIIWTTLFDLSLENIRALLVRDGATDRGEGLVTLNMSNTDCPISELFFTWLGVALVLRLVYGWEWTPSTFRLGDGWRLLPLLPYEYDIQTDANVVAGEAASSSLAAMSPVAVGHVVRVVLRWVGLATTVFFLLYMFDKKEESLVCAKLRHLVSLGW